MTRFDEVARLRELHAAAKPGPWLVYNDPSIRCPTCKTEADGRYMMALTHAPWLLEVATCFQPGDAELIGEWLYQLEEEYGSDGESPNQPITRMLARLQKAAAIMEGQE